MPNLNKIFTIAAREYNAVVRSKAFIVGLILLPVMMFGSLGVVALTKKVHDVNDHRFAVIDRTPNQVVFARLEKDVAAYNATAFDPTTRQQTKAQFILERIDPAPISPADSPTDPAAIDRQRLELSDRVRSGSLFGFLEIGSDVLKPLVLGPTSQPTDAQESQIVRYQTKTPTFFDFRDLASHSINDLVRSMRLGAAGIPPTTFEQLAAPVRIINKGLAQKQNDGRIVYGDASRELASIFVPIGLAFLMFMVVAIGAMPLLQGIVEEKQQRIAEVLLGSVSPFSLMAGKVLGMVATSFTLIAVYLGGAFWVAHQTNYSEYLPVHVLLWFVLFELLAVLMYGSLYIAIGASCTDAKEMQSLLMPVNLLMALPLIVIVAIVQSPSGPVAKIMTYVPPATPFITVVRLAMPPGLGWTEIAISIAIVIATTLFLIWASGRIFRVGILMQGKGANLSQLVKWVVKG